jgi:hypothetical protein
VSTADLHFISENRSGPTSPGAKVPSQVFVRGYLASLNEAKPSDDWK